jgi:hypothetical protein
MWCWLTDSGIPTRFVCLVDLLISAYTIVQSTAYSLAIDVLTDPLNNIGTLFLSDAEGIYFVEALSNTNRNDMGFVDFEALVGLEGIGLANVVRNAQEVLLGREEKKIRSLMTYDDGESCTTTSLQPGKRGG